MAKPNVLQQYIYNNQIQIQPSDWEHTTSSTYPYIYDTDALAIELTNSTGGFQEDNDYIILVKPNIPSKKAYLQYGIVASELIEGAYLHIRFRAKTLPSEKISVRYSMIIDTNTLK